jgi:hypothetical protein
MNRLNLLFSAATTALLLACSGTDEQQGKDLNTADEALSAGALQSVPGPNRLRGSCRVDNASFPFEVDAWSPPTTVYVGTESTLSGVYVGSVDVSLGSDFRPTRATLRSVRTRAWQLEGTTSKEVTNPGLAMGGSIALDDDALLAGRRVSCNATLIQQSAMGFTASDATHASLDDLAAPLLRVDVVLPGNISCGVALNFAQPLPEDALETFRRAFILHPSASSELVAMVGDRSITLRSVNDGAWNDSITIESRDHVTTVADALRTALDLGAAPAAVGTIENLVCER